MTHVSTTLNPLASGESDYWLGAGGVIIQAVTVPDELSTNNYHRNYCWLHDDGAVYFSATRKGGAMNCHFFTTSPRLSRPAINDFCAFVLKNHSWCKMITTQASRPSIMRLLPRIGFEHIGDYKCGAKAYARFKPWEV